MICPFEPLSSFAVAQRTHVVLVLVDDPRLIKRYPDIKFDPLALQSLYRFNNSLIRRDQEAVNLGKRQLFTSVAAIRPTGAEPSLAPKNGIYYLLENAPAQFSKSAIEIGRLYLYKSSGI